jgi:hypothetical protein
MTWIMRAAFLLTVVVVPMTLPAQQPVPGPGKEVSGFLRLRWGATAKDVTDAFGTPMMDKTNEGGNRVLVYKDRVVDRPALALFISISRRAC